MSNTLTIRNLEDEVKARLDVQTTTDLMLSSVTVAELSYGIERMPLGKKRETLAKAFRHMLEKDFDGRILPFDGYTALHYGPLVAERERAGKPISQADAMIAAICRSHGATLATRNVKDFDSLGLTVVDPWVRADNVE